MTDGEGNKPAISLLEQQEQQKRRPVAPSQTPAPYVLPYRPTPAVPPIARQPYFSGAGTGAEGSLRSNLSNASHSHARPPMRVNSGSGTLAAAAVGGSMAFGAADSLHSMFNHAGVAHLLAYTQHQLTQLQQVQTLLLQHMQALHQLHSSPGGATSLASTAALDGSPRPLPPPRAPLLPGLAEPAAAVVPGARADGYGAESAATSPAQIGYLAVLFSGNASPASSSVCGNAAGAALPSVDGEAPETRPPTGSEATALQPPPLQAAPEPPPARWPPRPSGQLPAALKQFPGAGVLSSPESTGTVGGSSPNAQEAQSLPPQYQEAQSLPPQYQQPPLGEQQGQARPHRHQPQPLGAPAVNGSASRPAFEEPCGQPAMPPGRAGTSSHPEDMVTTAAAVPLQIATGAAAKALESYYLAMLNTTTAAAVPPPGSASRLSYAPGPGSAALSAGARAEAPDADSYRPTPSGTKTTGGVVAQLLTALSAAHAGDDCQGVAPVARAQAAEPPAQCLPRPLTSTYTSPFVAPGPEVRLPAAPAADEARPLAARSLSLGLPPPLLPPHELLPLPVLLPRDASALGVLGPALQGPIGAAAAAVQAGPPGPHASLGSLAGFQRGARATGGLSPPGARAEADDAAAPAAVAAEAGGAVRRSGPPPPPALAGNKLSSRQEAPGPAGPELDAQLDADRKDFFVFPEDEGDGDDEDVEVVRREAWYKRAGVLWLLGSAFAATVLAVAGVCMDLGKVSKAAEHSEVFRWLYFVAGYVPIYWGVYLAVSRAFMLVEWVYFRENLFYLQNIKENATALVSMLLQLLWFMTCFEWLWCDRGRCDSESYQRARGATWKAVLCVMLFTLANVIKAVTAKLSSMQFYRTAHFKRLKDSLEKEYYLQLLSVPRSRILAQIQAAEEAHDGAGGGRHRLRTVLPRRSIFPPGAILSRLSHPTPMKYAGDGGGDAAIGAAGADDGDGHGTRAVASSTGADSQGRPVKLDGEGRRWDGDGGRGSGGSGGAAASDGPDGEKAGRALGRSSAAPAAARCSTWSGFWLCGAGACRARSDDPEVQPWQAGSQMTSSRGVGGGGGGCTGSPPKWNANFLAETSTVSSASATTRMLGGDPGGGKASGGNMNGPSEMHCGGVTVVVMTDGRAEQGETSGQTAFLSPPPLPPPPPPAAPPAPPPPPLPPAGSGVEASLVSGGGALGFVTAEPFITQTSAFFERSRDGRNSTLRFEQQQHSLQQQQQQRELLHQPVPPVSAGAVRGAVATEAAPPPPTASPTGSGDRVMSVHLMRLLSQVIAGRSASRDAGAGGRSASQVMPSPPPVVRARSRPDSAQGPQAGGGSGVRSRSNLGGSPPRRLKSLVAEALDGMAPQLQRRLASLGAEAFNVVPLDIKKKKAVHDMTEAELERIRDTIVIKTYTALIRKHSGMSEAEQLCELRTVKRFAKALYLNMRGPDPSKTHITLDDFKLFFGDDEQMMRKAFQVFDADKDGKLSRGEVRDRVVAIYTERRNMARSLRDTDSIVRSLELSLGIAVHFLFGAIYLTIWGVPLLEGFSAFSATVLALTFIFGNSAKNAFESVLFLFFEHPYDVGDMVYFNGDSMRVKRISLMYTDFVKWTNEEVYIPNSKMMTADITNWTRTNTKFELHKILVDVGVPWEVKEDISNALVAHCNAHPNDFCGVPRVTFREVMDPLKVYLGIGFTYNFPPDDFDRLVPARDRLMFVVQSKLAEHRLLAFSKHRINHLEAAEEIRMAIQMRQLRELEGAEKSLMEDGVMAAQPQQQPQELGGAGKGAGIAGPPFSAAAAAGMGVGVPVNGGTAAAAAAQPLLQPVSELLLTRGGGGGGATGSGGGGGGGGLGTSSALPALGAEGLQQRPAAAAVAAPTSAASPAGGAAGASAAAAAATGADLEAVGKSKRD